MIAIRHDVGLRCVYEYNWSCRLPVGCCDLWVHCLRLGIGRCRIIGSGGIFPIICCCNAVRSPRRSTPCPLFYGLRFLTLHFRHPYPTAQVNLCALSSRVIIYSLYLVVVASLVCAITTIVKIRPLSSRISTIITV
ncbi:hypothetical protein OE88DRAFT_95031 [Heliocybe sulcata]|uniref:Uncharacterized protein n=1 Tax=Heliocybe sulcata TaxID=5364 RepID=A0A5C3NKU8_9AGAM|nr:hypothetical protein OE88DRAFT_95031 [Heliocybe sulcata]